MWHKFKTKKVKTILIIYPHWPPSNLAGVHRARLISNFLNNFGWKPLILTVKPEFYEEKPDYDLCKTVSADTEVIYTNAKPAPKHFRIIGDIALRSFRFLKKEALKIIATRKIDFIWIPIPAYYTAILGRQLYEKTKIPYGIDYIDPWVNGFPNSHKPLTRAWLSNLIAKLLEPYSVKKASLISGVSTPYYQAVLDRNFSNKNILHVGMPYGFDPNDHKIAAAEVKYPWSDIPNCKPIVYAGMFLPKSHIFVRLLFSSIMNLIDNGRWDKNIHLFFVGTGNYPEKKFSEYAHEYGIEDYVHEIHDRYPFLHILNFLSNSFGSLVIGSTEKHYTASKTFQAILSEKPVFAIFHEESSAVEVLKEAKSDVYLVCYKEKENEKIFSERIQNIFYRFMKQTDNWQPNYMSLDKYSAKNSAAMLVEKLNQIVK